VTTPPLAGISHVSLSVRDLGTSEAWYRSVLGLVVYDRPPGESWTEVVLGLPGTNLVVCLQCHAANDGSTFTPLRTGLDHLALEVSAREDLDAWAAHLAALGVTHSPVADRGYGSVLSLRDPDDVQLEIFWLSPDMAAAIPPS
jgi:glyoxylase I family protein